jgi:hypothetical protein
MSMIGGRSSARASVGVTSNSARMKGNFIRGV